jgi:hypothetical protein
MKNRINTRHTEDTGIIIAMMAPGVWQHVDTNDNRVGQVGPQYRTKAEALTDHESYMRRGGWIKD